VVKVAKIATGGSLALLASLAILAALLPKKPTVEGFRTKCPILDDGDAQAGFLVLLVVSTGGS
jgi:hypothetical protein